MMYSVKLDGCGAQRDLQLFSDLFAEKGASILIENCHWGQTVPNTTWYLLDISWRMLSHNSSLVL